jgi:hypothetical protein
MKGNVVHACLGYNILAIHKQLTGIASLVNKRTGKSTFVTDYVHWMN